MCGSLPLLPPPPPPISGLARNKLSGSRISSGTFWPICHPPPPPP